MEDNEEKSELSKIEKSKKYIIRKSKKLNYLIKDGYYEEARIIVEDLLANYNIDKAERVILQSQLVTILTKLGYCDEARNIVEGLLNNSLLNETQTLILQKQLEALPKVEKHVEELEPKYSKYESFSDGIILSEEDLNLLNKSYIANNYYEKKENKYTRTNLYKGNIQIDDLNELVENNNRTLPGCVFIAECCKYLGLEHLGMQALRGYRNNNKNILLEEQRALTKAMELLKIKDSIPLEEEWNKIYGNLDRANKEKEENDYIK